MTTPTTKRDSAIQLAQLNYRVFPLPPKQKAPPPERFYDVATTDVNMVNRWWTNPVTGESTDHNIGIATGDDLMVVDVDDVNADLPPDLFPTTQLVRTPSGGHHRYYEVDEGVANSASKIGKGIDVRGHHGYVVGPGSETDKGVYAWANDEAEAKAPDALIERAGRPGARAHIYTDATNATGTQQNDDSDLEADVERAVNWLKGAKPAIEGEGGERVTLETAFRVRDYGVSLDTCVELMFEHWNDRCEPPWDIDGLRVKTENAYKYAQNKFGVSSLSEFEVVPEGEVVDRRLPPTPRGPLRDLAQLDWTPRTNYVIREMLFQGSVGFVTGKSDVGKTPLVMDMAAHVARGRDWMGKRVRPGLVVYVGLEGLAQIGTRLEALRRKHFAGAEQSLFVVSTDALNLRDEREGQALAKLVNDEASARGGPVALIIIDTLSHSLGGGNESDPEHARTWMLNAKRLAAATRSAVVAVSHPPKDGSSWVRGSSVLVNDGDLILLVEVDTNGLRTVTTPRIKDGPAVKPAHFVLEAMDLARDDEGLPVRAMTVDWRIAAEFMPSALSPQERDVLDLIEATAMDEGVAELSQTTIYTLFPDIKKNALRVILKRISEKNGLLRLPSGGWGLVAPSDGQAQQGATEAQQGATRAQQTKKTDLG